MSTDLSLPAEVAKTAERVLDLLVADEAGAVKLQAEVAREPDTEPRPEDGPQELQHALAAEAKAPPSPVARLLSIAHKEIGQKERGTNHTKYGKWYGMDGVPWCDIFVSWVGAQAGQAAAIGKFAYCPSHVAWFKRQNRFGREPKPGAVVFFDFDGGGPDHVGIVCEVRKGHVITVEGNTGDAVMHRRRASHIFGYGYPAYAAD